MLPPPLEAASIWVLRLDSTSNLTWVKVNVESRIEGAGSPHAAVADSENWKLEAKRKPMGLKRMDGCE